MTEPVRTAILISGRGSNMTALIEAARQPDYAAKIVMVLTDRPDAAGLAIAREAAVLAELLDYSAFPGKKEFEAALHSRLVEAGVELVCLAGFMRILTAQFVEKWRGRILNIHPSLLPEFRGLHTHKRAISSGKAEHGCTVHYVSAELDAGPIVAQARVPVFPDDDPASLAARVLVEEHRIYPEALNIVARQLKITGAPQL